MRDEKGTGRQKEKELDLCMKYELSMWDTLDSYRERQAMCDVFLINVNLFLSFPNIPTSPTLLLHLLRSLCLFRAGRTSWLWLPAFWNPTRSLHKRWALHKNITYKDKIRTHDANWLKAQQPRQTQKDWEKVRQTDATASQCNVKHTCTQVNLQMTALNSSASCWHLRVPPF